MPDHAQSDPVQPGHAQPDPAPHGHAPHGNARFDPAGGHRLNDPRRLETQLSGADLARLLDLRGSEDLVDLGSGTGFYTDRMAALTSGTVYAVELQPEMHDLYRERGVPANVRLVPGDVTHLTLPAASADAACCIMVYHETEGGLDVAGLARILRPGGKVLIVDWRKDPESWERGPSIDIRFSKEEVVEGLAPYFAATLTEDLSPFTYAVVARRRDQVPGS